MNIMIIYQDWQTCVPAYNYVDFKYYFQDLWRKDCLIETYDW